MRQTAPVQAAVERRRKPRIAEPFPVQLAGRDCQGAEFRLQTVIGNLSASGLYVEVPRELAPGARLRLVIRLIRAGQGEQEAATVAAEAVVVRRQRLDRQRWGVGMSLVRRRVI
jgi:hypothetical protein